MTMTTTPEEAAEAAKNKAKDRSFVDFQRRLQRLLKDLRAQREHAAYAGEFEAANATLSMEFTVINQMFVAEQGRISHLAGEGSDHAERSDPGVVADGSSRLDALAGDDEDGEPEDYYA